MSGVRSKEAVSADDRRLITGWINAAEFGFENEKRLKPRTGLRIVPVNVDAEYDIYGDQTSEEYYAYELRFNGVGIAGVDLESPPDAAYDEDDVRELLIESIKEKNYWELREVVSLYYGLEYLSGPSESQDQPIVRNRARMGAGG